MWPLSRRIRPLVPLMIAFTLLIILLTFLQVQAAVLPAAPLDVVLNEIAWMDTTESANDEWVELFNTTADPINLSGWLLWASGGLLVLSAFVLSLWVRSSSCVVKPVKPAQSI